MTTQQNNTTAPGSIIAPGIASCGCSRVYRREDMNDKPTSDGSLRYSRAQARKIFKQYPSIEIVEYIDSGRKTDSQFIGRGHRYSPEGVYVWICSTSGRWGRPSRHYLPLSIREAELESWKV